MARSREVIHHKDFRGGLNLTTQLQALNEDESPDALNVDFGQRGGFTLRGGFATIDYSQEYSGARFLCPIYFAADEYLMVASDGQLLEWDGANLSLTGEDVTDTALATAPVRACSFDSKAYIANGRTGGNIVMYSWDGSTLTTLGSTFNDDYLAPTDGNMPDARFIAEHNGYMWIADTNESSVRYPHRLRFSHLQKPEDWATNDYFDLDPDDDGDPVTGIVPFRDHLLVFKKSSVHAIFGESRDDFFRETISNSSGVSDVRAVTTNSGVCYWMANDGRVMAWNGRGIVPLTDALSWWADLGKIKQGGDHILMWGANRLWMSLEAGAGEPSSRWLFVYDPTIKALTRYDKLVTDMAFWYRIDTEPDPLFLFAEDITYSDWNMYRFDRANSTDTDTPDTIDDQLDDPLLDVTGDPLRPVDTSGTRNIPIDGYYRTGWFDAGETATKKRWKRPRVTAAAEGDTTIRMEVYHDFNESIPIKFSDIIIDTEDAADWGTLLWGDSWGDDQSDTYSFTRQPSAGSAYAIQFKFSATNNPGRWWVDSISIPFRRKQVR